jgi:tRNA-dihydrouridine synthase
MNVLQQLPKPFLVLAPMDDVTDTVFRQIVAGCAPPDLYFTEFVNVDGLQSPGRPKLMKKLRFSAAEQPLIAQIWGKEPENFRKTAAELVDMGFAGVDLNMGCPEKTVVKNGCCSALINNPELAAEIIQATKEGVAGRVPVSVKTRIGFNTIDLTWIEFLLGQGLDMLTIHGRTR